MATELISDTEKQKLEFMTPSPALFYFVNNENWLSYWSHILDITKSIFLIHTISG